MPFPLIPLLLLGGGATFLFLAPKAAAGGTIGPPEKIRAPIGSRFAIELTATNIGGDELERHLAASMQAKGNRLVKFEMAPGSTRAGGRYAIIVEYGTSGLISINLPLKSAGGVVITTLSARRL